MLIGIVGVILMFKNAPADTKKKPIVNRKRRMILKIISTISAIIFVVSAIIIKNNFLSNCLIFALILILSSGQKINAETNDISLLTKKVDYEVVDASYGYEDTYAVVHDIMEWLDDNKLSVTDMETI